MPLATECFAIFAAASYPMSLLRGVTIDGDMPANAAARSRFASRPAIVLSARTRTVLASRRIDSSSAVPITGIATFSSNAPDAPAHAIVASLPMTRAHTISVASGTTGLTLPGMIEDPGCRSGMCSSPRPVFGPEPIQRRSLLILVSETAIVRSAPDASTRPSRFACASKWSFASVIGSSVSATSSSMTFWGKPERRVDAGADGRAAERNLRDPRQHRLHPLDAQAHLSCVAAELLPERDRGRVHQVRAAGLDGVLPQLRLLLEGDREVVERRDEVVDELLGDGDVHRRREHVVGGLRGVHVVVGVHRRAEATGREGRQHLVHVHVRRGAAAGLVDVDREVGEVLAGDDVVGGRGDRVGDRRPRAFRAPCWPAPRTS